MEKEKNLKGYTNLQKIAKGGMGEVYRAIHQGLNKEVILKKLIARAPGSFTERFKREAAIMMEVSHPNIVHIFDYFKEGKTSYIAMEYVPGYDLAKLMKKFGQLPVYLAAYIVYEIAKGLQHAHSKEIIHRDIKPGNVLISKKGDIKLTDFGIAFKTDRQKKDDITKTGTLLGTPAYMSPEQIRSSKDVDSRTDIYSLGVLFYEMLAGKRPFTNDFTMENVTKIRKGKYPGIRSINKKVPPRLVKVIKKMMHPAKIKRYESIDQFIRKIEPFLMRKFSDLKNLRQHFSDLIQNETTKELNSFQYARIFIHVNRLVKISIITLLGAGFLYLFQFFFPQAVVRFLPAEYGLARVELQGIPGSLTRRIECTAENKNGKKYFINNHWLSFLKWHGLSILPANKYRLQLFYKHNIYQSEFIVYPYKNKKINHLKLVIPRPQAQAIKIFINAVDGSKNEPVKNYTLFYKTKEHPEWQKYTSVTELKNGQNFDFRLTAPGYNAALIDRQQLTEWQENLFLNFVLTPQKFQAAVSTAGESLDLLVNGLSDGWIDRYEIKKQKYQLGQKVRYYFFAPGRHKITVLKDKKVVLKKTVLFNSNIELHFKLNKNKKLILDIKKMP